MKASIKKVVVFVCFFAVSFAFMSCAPAMQSQRVSLDQSDALASTITDKWVAKDTQLCVEDILKQIKANKTYQEYSAKLGRKAKIFVANVNNQSSEAYFPIDDLNDELLYNFSMDGSFIMIDAAVREKLLKEIQYQNDGMVDPAQAKSIGKASGADLMIFGDVRMKPETSGGRTIKDYTVNLRMTNAETQEVVLMVRYRTSKYSQQKKSGW